MRACFLAVVLIGYTLSMAEAQGPQKPRPSEFEVASIRIAKDSAAQPSVRITPGRLGVTNMPLRQLILASYKLQSFQLDGAPGWISSARYGINATTDPANGADPILLMLQNLIETRFQFHFHRETKEGPAYLLTITKGGSKLRPADCVPFDPNNIPKQIALSNEERKRQCAGITKRSGELDGSGMPMEDPAGPAFQSLAGQLTLILDRPVVNKTGLMGLFDVHLRWTPSQVTSPENPGDFTRPDVPDASGPSIFTALQEQLGLRLESGKAPVNFFVVDHNRTAKRELIWSDSVKPPEIVGE